MSETIGFKFQGTGKLARVDKFITQKGKTVITLVFEEGGDWPQMIPIKVFGRLAEMASEWKLGDILEVTGKLGGREWNGKFYGDAVAQTVEVAASGEGKSKNENGAVPAAENDDQGSIPF